MAYSPRVTDPPHYVVGFLACFTSHSIVISMLFKFLAEMLHARRDIRGDTRLIYHGPKYTTKAKPLTTEAKPANL